MINVIIADQYSDKLTPHLLEQAALATLRQQGEVEEMDLSLVIDEDERLHELNQEYLGIDAPTDVLSFPSGEEEIDPESGRFYLGDVIISYPRALEQSAAAGHHVLDELQLLVVHGVLHLLGHDHAEAEEKARMWAAQQETLTSLGVRLMRMPE